MERLHQVGTVREKSMIKVHETNKLMQLHGVETEVRKITDGLNLHRWRSDTMLVNVKLMHT